MNSKGADHRDTSRKIYIGMTLFIIFAAIICACLILFTPKGYRSFSISFGGKTELRQETALEIEENTLLSVLAYADNVYFYRSNSNKLEIKEYYRSKDKRARIEHSGGKVSIEGERRWGITLFQFPFFGEADRIEVYLPEDDVADIAVAVSSGNIRSDLTFAGERISLATSSGRIDWKKLDAAEVRLKASSGNIHVEEAQGQVMARVSSGNIVIDRVEGFFTADISSGNITVATLIGGAAATASSGEVRLTVAELREDVYARTNSGNVRITLPQDSTFTFAADTNSGSIRTDFDEQLSYNKKGNSAHGTIGDGSRYAVTAEAKSGSVRVMY